jgi:hypothetical protein
VNAMKRLLARAFGAMGYEFNDKPLGTISKSLTITPSRTREIQPRFFCKRPRPALRRFSRVAVPKSLPFGTQ